MSCSVVPLSPRWLKVATEMTCYLTHPHTPHLALERFHKVDFCRIFLSSLITDCLGAVCTRRGSGNALANKTMEGRVGEVDLQARLGAPMTFRPPLQYSR